MNLGIRNQIRDLAARSDELTPSDRVFIQKLAKAPISYQLSAGQYRYLKIIVRKMDKGAV